MPKRHRDESIVWSPGNSCVQAIDIWVDSSEYTHLKNLCTNPTRPYSRTRASIQLEEQMKVCLSRLSWILDRYPETEGYTYVRLRALYALTVNRCMTLQNYIRGNTWKVARGWEVLPFSWNSIDVELKALKSMEPAKGGASRAHGG